MNKKPYIYKRVIAYLIDIIIVSLLASLISAVFIDNENYTKDSERIVELAKKLSSNEIEREEYLKEFDELNYDLTKDSVGVTLVTCGVTVVYFVILCYFCHGITLGKYIMKIKIVSANDNDLNIFNYFLRCILADLIISHSSGLILFYALSKEDFIKYYSKVNSGITLLLLLSFILILFRNDGRGIHDFMGNTKVVNINDEDNNEEKDNKEEIETKKEVTDAVIVHEKKKTVKKKKKEVK